MIDLTLQLTEELWDYYYQSTDIIKISIMDKQYIITPVYATSSCEESKQKCFLISVKIGEAESIKPEMYAVPGVLELDEVNSFVVGIG